MPSVIEVPFEKVILYEIDLSQLPAKKGRNGITCRNGMNRVRAAEQRIDYWAGRGALHAIGQEITAAARLATNQKIKGSLAALSCAAPGAQA